jgi:hypothetical protein
MINQQMNSNKTLYHIRVAGRLDQKWADWFEGFAVTSRGDGETLLSGEVVDQAALHGVLDKIHGLGLPLRLVIQAECPCSSKNCSQRGKCSECMDYHATNGGQPYCFKVKTRWNKQCLKLMT